MAATFSKPDAQPVGDLADDAAAAGHALSAGVAFGRPCPLRPYLLQQPRFVGTRGFSRTFRPPHEHDPEKLVLDLIGDGNRFSDKIMLKQNYAAMAELVDALA